MSTHNLTLSLIALWMSTADESSLGRFAVNKVNFYWMYRRAGPRCFGLLALISRPQVRYIYLPERMILPGSLIPSDKCILKNLTFVVRIHSCGLRHRAGQILDVAE